MPERQREVRTEGRDGKKKNRGRGKRNTTKRIKSKV